MLHSVCFRHLFSCGACTGSTREPADFSTDVKEPAVSIHPAASREQLADSGRVPDASPASSGTALANSVDQVAALVNSIRYHGRGLQQVQRQPLAEDRASSGASHVQAPSSLSSASKTATAANMMAEDLSVALMMACSVEIADDAGAHGAVTTSAATWDAQSAALAGISSPGGAWPPICQAPSHPLPRPPAPVAPRGRHSEEEGLFRMSLTGTTDVASEPRTSDTTCGGDDKRESSSSQPAHCKSSSLLLHASQGPTAAQPQQQDTPLCTGKEAVVPPCVFAGGVVRGTGSKSQPGVGPKGGPCSQLPQQHASAGKVQAGAGTAKAVRRAITANCTYYVIAPSPPKHVPAHPAPALMGGSPPAAAAGQMQHHHLLPELAGGSAPTLSMKPSDLLRRKSALAGGSCQPPPGVLVSAVGPGGARPEPGLMHRHSLPFTSHHPPPLPLATAECGQDYMTAMAYATGVSVAGTSSTTSSTATSGGSSGQVHLAGPRPSGRRPSFTASEGGLRVRSVPAKSPSRLARCTTNTDIPSSIDEEDSQL